MTMATPLRPGSAGAGTHQAARLGDLRPVLDELLAATAVGEAELVAAVEAAVARSVTRDDPETAGTVAARFDPVTGSVDVHRVGPEGGVEPVHLGPEAQRQAALGVRVAVATLIREAERSRVIREGAARRGELVDTIVERSEGPVWSLRVGDIPAILPPEEQMPGERIRRGQHLQVVVVEVRRRLRDAVLVVSRSHPALIRRLLEREVPEMAAGQVVIRNLVREPGRRSKVAVEAPRGGVDPEGACIGPRGVRHRAVVTALGEEQVQVVAWSADAATYVARALRPAGVTRVDLDEDTRTAHVVVPDSQLSLAIGRSGENARLAAKLTGWRIDIRGEGTP